MSLKRVSEKLGEQNELLMEIALDIYGYLDSAISKVETSSKTLDAINATNNNILNVVQSFQTQGGDALEEKRDNKLADSKMLSALEGIQKNTKGGATSKKGFGETAGKGIGAGVGAGLGFAMKGLGAVATLGALGFGIGAFFTGLALGDKAQAMIGTDMSATKKNMITLGEAFAETPTEGLLAMGVLAGVGAKFGSMEGALKMGFFGAGIGAFFSGLALGDKGMSLLNTDGSALKNMMVSLGEGLNAFSGTSLVALGGLIAFGSAFGAAAAVGLPLLGTGLSLFFGAFDLAALAGIDGSGLGTMLGNLATGLAPLSELNGLNLGAVGLSMVALGAGMTALFGGTAIAKVFSVIGSVFSGKDDEDMFTKLYNGLLPLSTLNADNLKGLGDISSVIDGLSDSLDRLIDTDYDAVNDSIGKFGKTMAYAIPMLAAMKGQGTGEDPYVVGEGWFDGQRKLNFSPGLNSFSNEDVQMMNNIASAGTQISSNSSGQQQKSTSAGNVGKLVTEQAAVSSTPPVVIMDNSTNSSSSGGGGGTTVLGGPISPFDLMDPYFSTRS